MFYYFGDGGGIPLLSAPGVPVVFTPQGGGTTGAMQRRGTVAAAAAAPSPAAAPAQGGTASPAPSGASQRARTPRAARRTSPYRTATECLLRFSLHRPGPVSLEDLIGEFQRSREGLRRSDGMRYSGDARRVVRGVLFNSKLFVRSGGGFAPRPEGRRYLEERRQLHRDRRKRRARSAKRRRRGDSDADASAESGDAEGDAEAGAGAGDVDAWERRFRAALASAEDPVARLCAAAPHVDPAIVEGLFRALR